MSNHTDASQVIADLDGGVFLKKLTHALGDVALGAIISGKTGKVTFELSFKPFETTSQVEISHKLKFDKPTDTGKLVEETTRKTPFYVGKGGCLSILPFDQEAFDFMKRPSHPHADK